MKNKLIVLTMFFSVLFGCGEMDDFGDVAYYHYENATDYKVVIEKRISKDELRTDEISSKDTLVLSSSKTGVIPFMDDEKDSSKVIVRFISEPESCFVFLGNTKMKNDIRFDDAYLQKDEELYFVITDDMLKEAKPCE